MMTDTKNSDFIRAFHSSLPEKIRLAADTLRRQMTLSEKILYAHLFDISRIRPFARGADYVNFAPDRVAMQDATAQMALLQFMNSV